MPDIKFTFDPAMVKITDGEILADLTYPVRPAAAGRVREGPSSRPEAGKR